MSDFDEEAERERLREQYERDKQQREATEKMSELLLQGATMTNAHCSACGDPIFRYDGQEFCPTCERPVERADDGSESADGAGGSESDGGSEGGIEVTTPSDEARVAFGGADADNVDADTGRSQDDPETTARRSRPRDGSTPPSSPDDSERPQQSPPTENTRDEQERPEESTGEGAPRTRTDTDPGAAREPLVRALVRFSERAAATDDPRRASDHLAAAREAAETLAALDRR